MQTTPNLLIPFPELSDPANVPADMERLAMAVDAALVTGAPGGVDIIVRDLNAQRALYVAGTRLAPPYYGTTPPANPFDGQEWYLLADAANGVMWKFRYRPDAPAPNRWEFVGGSWLRQEILGQQVSTTSTTAVDLDGPVITVPRSGDYIVRFGASPFGPPTGNPNVYTDLYVGGVYPGVQNRLFLSNSAGQHQGSLMREMVVSANAGQQIRMRYSVQSGTGYWNNRTLHVQPVRVS